MYCKNLCVRIGRKAGNYKDYVYCRNCAVFLSRDTVTIHADRKWYCPCCNFRVRLMKRHHRIRDIRKYVY